MPDPHDLARFESAQAPIYHQALAELVSGRKRSHWMWFIFPQVAGLGLSDTSRRYASASLAEARAYLAHPLLGVRLVECTRAVCTHRGTTALAIFGSPDDAKFRSSLTLFGQVSDDFHEALTIFFDGQPDSKTLEMLEK